MFTTIPGACRVILGSTHPDRYDVLDFLVERHNHLQDQAWEAQKTEHVALDDSIPVAKNYRELIYFVFKLGEPALLWSKKIAYEYACISRYPWRMKNGINNFREKHPGSIIILKMVNDPLRIRKENLSITFLDVTSVYTKGIIIFCWWMMITKMMVTEKSPKSYKRIFYNICYWYGTAPPIKVNFHILQASF